MPPVEQPRYTYLALQQLEIELAELLREARSEGCEKLSASINTLINMTKSYTLCLEKWMTEQNYRL